MAMASRSLLSAGTIAAVGWRDLLADAHRVGPGESQMVLPCPEPPEVQVVDDLLEKISASSMKRDVALDVSGRAKPGEDLHAEAVGGFDGGCVEVGDGFRQPVPAHCDVLGVPPASRQRTSSSWSGEPR